MAKRKTNTPKDPERPAHEQQRTDTPPIKEPNPGEAQTDRAAPEVPKVGSRDAPGG